MDRTNDTQAALQAIQEMIAQDAPLERTLGAICVMIERELPEAMTSIMLFDSETQSLSLEAGGRLPAAFRNAAQHVPIGPEAAICGTAAFYRKPVLCPDILEDPRCSKYWHLARDLELRAGWSYPVLASVGHLLGTFAVYYHTPGTPTEAQRLPIQSAAALVALAVERHRDRRALLESEQHYRSLFTHNPDGVFSLDASGVLKSVNSAACNITGLPEARLIGMHYADFIVAHDIHETDARFDKTMRGEPQRYEVRIIDVSGEKHVLDVTNLPIMVDGAVAGVYGIAKDVTQRKAQDTQLRILQRSVETSVNGVVIADAKQADLPLIYANEPFLRMTGYALEDVLGRNCRFLQGRETDPDSLEVIRKNISQSREVRMTLLNYCKDGATFWNDMYVSPVSNDTGEITHFVGILHDVSLQKAHEENLAYQANHEQLTGLPNRSLLETRLTQAYTAARKHDGVLAVLYIDLDDFKPVNDALGHAVGDQLLKTVAHRLSSLLSPGDTLASVGGDEFVILLPNLEAEEQALATAERALGLLDKPHRIDTHDIHVTGSIGIAASSDDAVTHALELIQHADMAMYVAKHQGRNTIAGTHTASPPPCTSASICGAKSIGPLRPMNSNCITSPWSTRKAGEWAVSRR